MNKLLLLLFLFTACASHHEKAPKVATESVATKKECLKYENVSLQGKLEKRPSPRNKSNYFWVLVTQPFCTQIPADEELYQAFEYETEIHLAVEAYDPYRNLVGKQVIVTGELYSIHTGHHFRNILISVDKIEPRQ